MSTLVVSVHVYGYSFTEKAAVLQTEIYSLIYFYGY
jgi:hypothetical protein